MKKPPIETKLYKGFFRSNYLIITNQYCLSIVFVDNRKITKDSVWVKPGLTQIKFWLIIYF